VTLPRFYDDDAGFAAWFKDNPNGFVLNDKSAERILHKISCASLWPFNNARRRTVPAGKVCGNRLMELIPFANAHFGKEGWRVCKHCRPLAHEHKA
jgi:hypothetical protein